MTRPRNGHRVQVQFALCSTATSPCVLKVPARDSRDLLQALQSAAWAGKFSIRLAFAAGALLAARTAQCLQIRHQTGDPLGHIPDHQITVSSCHLSCLSTSSPGTRPAYRVLADSGLRPCISSLLTLCDGQGSPGWHAQPVPMDAAEHKLVTGSISIRKSKSLLGSQSQSSALSSSPEHERPDSGEAERLDKQALHREPSNGHRNPISDKATAAAAASAGDISAAPTIEEVQPCPPAP